MHYFQGSREHRSPCGSGGGGAQNLLGAAYCANIEALEGFLGIHGYWPIPRDIWINFRDMGI